MLADVPRWRSIPIARDVPYDELEGYLAEAARAAGWPHEQAMPFLIEGPVHALAWHVVDGARIPEGERGHSAHLAGAVRGRIEGGAPTLVGFYSDHHQGVFTHHDSRMHMHFTDRSRDLCGHVDHVDIAAGSILRIPVPAPDPAAQAAPR